VQTGAGDAAFSRSNYNDYDLVNNLKSITREEDSWKGELFEYDDANQLRSASYRVDVAPHAPDQADPVPGQLGTVETVSEDSEKDALAVLEADPDREPLAQRAGSGGGLDSYSGPRVVTYVNDSINRLSMSDNGTVTNYIPNSLNQYTTVGNHTPLYDTKFNLLSGYDDWVYTYDADRRLISAVSAADGGHQAQFVYDGLGRCVRRTIDGTATVLTYDEWKPIVEWTGAGVFVAWNLYGPGADEILVRYQPNTGGHVHYHLDAMGNVQFLLSGELNLGLEKYTYDAFGKPKIVGWNGDVRAISRYGNRFLFTGREYLYTLGIYDYRHRHYHPGLGRFIQTDPIGFGGDPMNLYRYCSGNPILHGDPTGLYDPNSNNKLNSNGFGGEWIDGSDGLSDRDRHDHTSMGSDHASGENAAKSLSSKDEGYKQQPSNANARKETGGSDVTIKRTIVTNDGRVLWIIFHRGLVYFEYEVTAAGKPVGAGVKVTESIAYGKSKSLFSSAPKTSTGITDAYGHIGDNYAASFTSKSGYVTVTQTLRIEGAGEVQFKGVLHADGRYQTNIFEATFH
jgi:RHS repeat-associated protein